MDIETDFIKENISSAFNIWDWFLRIIPGVITVLMWVIVIEKSIFSAPASNEVIMILVIFVFGLLVGTVNSEIGFIFKKHWFDKWNYNGNPKKLYCSNQKGKFVIRDKYTRKMAISLVEEIMLKTTNIDTIEKYKSMPESDQKHLHKFALSYMINYLECRGLSNKSERMDVLSNMSRTMIISLLMGILGQIVLCVSNLTAISLKLFIIEIVPIFLFLIILYRASYKFEQYRFDNIIRTYYIATHSS